MTNRLNEEPKMASHIFLFLNDTREGFQLKLLCCVCYGTVKRMKLDHVCVSIYKQRWCQMTGAV